MGAEFGQHELGMVATRRRLRDARGAIGGKASEQNRGFHLGRCDRRIVIERLEVARAMNRERQRVLAFGQKLRAHPRKRARNATHGAAAKRIVAGELHVDIPRGKNAHEQTRRGAGIAAIDWLARRDGPLRAPTRDTAIQASIGSFFQIHLGAELAYRAKGAANVFRIEHARKARGAFGHRREKHRAMRNGFVARHRDAADKRAVNRLDSRKVFLGSHIAPPHSCESTNPAVCVRSP